VAFPVATPGKTIPLLPGPNPSKDGNPLGAKLVPPKYSLMGIPRKTFLTFGQQKIFKNP